MTSFANNNQQQKRKNPVIRPGFPFALLSLDKAAQELPLYIFQIHEHQHYVGLTAVVHQLLILQVHAVLIVILDKVVVIIHQVQRFTNHQFYPLLGSCTVCHQSLDWPWQVAEICLGGIVHQELKCSLFLAIAKGRLGTIGAMLGNLKK